MLMTAAVRRQRRATNGQPWPEDSPARLATYNAIVGRGEGTGASVLDLNAMVCPAGRSRRRSTG